MCDTLQHRGPDDDGIVVRDQVGLGMRRLAIIDLASGAQPMFNDDRSVALVQNGEIYNYRELRADLARRGHRFVTQSDTEVLIRLWEEYGEDFPTHLNGMFAIALHDERAAKLVLVRDRLGIKPLYVYLDEQRLVFGSEIKALLACDHVPRELDLDALGEFLAWEYVPAPRTLFRGIHKIEPGAMLVLDLNGGDVRERVWWDLPGLAEGAHEVASRNGLPSSPAEWEEAIDAQIARSVKAQLVADVPLGAFLSGGVDSSLVVAGMGEEALTFSIGFDDPSYNELQWSHQVAEHLGVRHETEVLRPDVVALFDRLMNHMDDPIGDFSIFPTYLVSQLARRDVKVVLTGDGGDEIFGGYDTYVAQHYARTWERIPSFLRRGLLEPALRGLPPRPQKKGLVNKTRRFVEGLALDPSAGHARWRAFVTGALRGELFAPAAQEEMRTATEGHVLQLAERGSALPAVDRDLYVDMKSYLSDNCLVKMDRMSMACSLEARVPLLDHELVELAFRMPSRLKVKGGGVAGTKPLLKKVAARHLPHDAVYRPKEGFSIPLKQWLGNEFRELMEAELAPSVIERDGIFQASVVERLKREHLAGRANHSHVLWGLLVFHDWRRRWNV